MHRIDEDARSPTEHDLREHKGRSGSIGPNRKYRTAFRSEFSLGTIFFPVGNRSSEFDVHLHDVSVAVDWSLDLAIDRERFPIVSFHESIQLLRRSVHN
jgi:hypothetical protein